MNRGKRSGAIRTPPFLSDLSEMNPFSDHTCLSYMSNAEWKVGS
jgi:hypothetical protein